jgi:hypothetical protein
VYNSISSLTQVNSMVLSTVHWLANSLRIEFGRPVAVTSELDGLDCELRMARPSVSPSIYACRVSLTSAYPSERTIATRGASAPGNAEFTICKLTRVHQR